MTTQNEHDWVRLAASVELPMRRLVDGRGTGSRRSRRSGDGFDIAGVRPFRDGDEIRRVDWSATARTGELHVRTTHAESGMRTLVAIDMNPSMSFGTDGWKADTARDIVMLLGHAAARRGDQVAVSSASSGTSRAASGVRAQRLLTSFVPAAATAPTGHLAELLVADTRPAVPSGLVVIVTEVFSELFTTYADVLSMVGARHELLVVAVHDPVEVELPSASATYVFRAPGSGTDVIVDLSDRAIRDSYHDAVATLRTRARDAVAEAGGFFVEISTSGDVPEDVIAACNTLANADGTRR